MKRNDINVLLRQYAKDHLSPTPEERKLVSDIYGAIQAVLGAANCLQIGSYPRFTAVTPLHDLDVLYVLGAWNPLAHNPSAMLSELERRLTASFKNPTRWKVSFRLQTHSVMILFKDNRDEEVLSVDVVPAFSSGRNEFGQDMYFVPEIAEQGHRARIVRYQQLAERHQEMQWIRSDPRGYIEVAKRTDLQNPDFRKSVKLIKGWHYSCKDAFDTRLKSFHIEQIIVGYFRAQPQIDVFGAIFKFFFDLPSHIRKAQIQDRADATKFIDEYINKLGFPEKRNIQEARDGFLIKLENFDEIRDVKELLAAYLRERAGGSEVYLFDQGIPVLTEYPISIEAKALQGVGWRESILNKIGLIKRDRKIQFRIRPNANVVDLYKWKIKNDDASAQPRGEISDHQTYNDPEHTKYDGTHYAECYAIKNKICVAKARQLVTLDRG